MNPPVFIIGGGITGLSIGWHLAKAGRAVTILEKGDLPDGSTSIASGAAAGMISPAGEVMFQEEHLLPLYSESTKLWPNFVEKLGVQGSEIDFYKNGTLFTAIDDDDKAELTRLYEHQKNLGISIELLDSEKLQTLEPHLSPRVSMSAWVRDEYSVDCLKLLQVLKKQFEECGGQYLSRKEVSFIKMSDKGVTALTIRSPNGSAEDYPVTQVVMASGLKMIDADAKITIPLRPVKGQALELVMPENLRIQRTVRSLHKYPVYLVPRSNGHLVVGATSEEQGMNADKTAGALLDLLYGAWKIFPATYEMKFVDTWTGLRPATKDHAPVLGETEIKNLYLAMGLYRHGYLMAPLLGQTMANLILGKEKPEWIEKYSYKRFHTPS